MKPSQPARRRSGIGWLRDTRVSDCLRRQFMMATIGFRTMNNKHAAAKPRPRRCAALLERLEKRALMSADSAACLLIYIEPSAGVADPYAPYCFTAGELPERVPAELPSIQSPIASQPPSATDSEAVPQDKVVTISLEIVDANGEPTNCVQVGEVVQLRIVAHDLRDSPLGLFGATVDIVYPPGFIPSGPAEIDAYFANFRNGSHYRPGLIDELGGYGGLDYPSNPRKTILATIPMRAVAPGAQTVTLDPADMPGNDVLLHGWDDAVTAGQIDYVGTTVTVIGRESARAPTDSVDQVFEAWQVFRNSSQLYEVLSNEPATSFATLTEHPSEDIPRSRFVPHEALVKADAPSAHSTRTPTSATALGNELTFLYSNQEVSLNKLAKPGAQARYIAR